MKHKLLITGLATLSALCCSGSPVLAQESRVETQAARCSAIFAILSETHAEDAARSKYFLHFMEVFTALSLKEKKERTGSASAEEGSTRRNSLLSEFRANYPNQQAAINDETILCGAWAEGYRAQGDQYAYVPIIPKLIPQSVRDEYQSYATTSWKKWIK
jgi:hypothetical protein